MKTKVALVNTNDPMATRVAGVHTFVRGFIRHAPDDIDIELVGITTSPKERPLRRWTSLAIGPKQFRLMPVLFEGDVNRKPSIPLSLRFTFALSRHHPDLTGRVLLFNRIEPAVVFRSSRYRKIGFVHNDIQKRVARGSEDYWRYFPWLYFRFEERICKSLDHLFTVNRNSLEFYRERYPFLEGRLDFLPTWTDPELFHPANGEPHEDRRQLSSGYGLPAESAWVLFVGRLMEQKAPLKLIESFHEYKRRRTDAELLIIGTGHLKAKTEDLARKLGISKSVHFLGPQTQELLASFYRASDVLLLTSEFEGMPRCCLEALGSGLPVVSTHAGEVPAVVRNGRSGEVSDDSSPEAIAAALEKVVNNRNTQYTLANCLEAVVDYTPQVVLKPVYELCRRLGSNGRPGRLTAGPRG